MSEIRIERLYKIFGSRPESVLQYAAEGLSKEQLLEEHHHVLGLKDINIDIPAKRISVIMGLSGSGKSTLVRHINRLIEPTSGTITVDGEDVLSMPQKELIKFRRFKASMVFQHFGLHVHKTIADNVAYGLIVQGVPTSQAIERSQKWIDRVGLAGYEGHYPSQLSGGMQQRVGLARALATDADILLMDEAFSALDPLIRYDMQSMLLELQEELQKTIVFITHDLDEALRVGDKIVILRDGEVVQQGDPQELIVNPADDYVFDFVKEINRGRVLKIGTLVKPGECIESVPVFQQDRVLEEVLQEIVASGSQTANVLGASGECLGNIHLDQVVSAMARPERKAGDTQYG